ncbi:MAG: hypothetical protein EOO39_06220 [Cytophagaceae bacterium]|nr:MAG: hypothetical protein EOO39_06220 [Cytophagaceae bacterium]
MPNQQTPSISFICVFSPNGYSKLWKNIPHYTIWMICYALATEPLGTVSESLFLRLATTNLACVNISGFFVVSIPPFNQYSPLEQTPISDEAFPEYGKRVSILENVSN